MSAIERADSEHEKAMAEWRRAMEEWRGELAVLPAPAAVTPVIETEILAAVLDEDHPRAKELLSGMTVAELRCFAAQVWELQQVVQAEGSRRAVDL